MFRECPELPGTISVQNNKAQCAKLFKITKHKARNRKIVQISQAQKTSPFL